MNKNDLIAAISEATGNSKSDTAATLDSLIATITTALSNGDDVQLVGFGTFSVADRPARQGRNPRTGEAMTIAASRAPKFKAGKGLKDAVNG